MPVSGPDSLMVVWNSRKAKLVCFQAVYKLYQHAHGTFIADFNHSSCDRSQHNTVMSFHVFYKLVFVYLCMHMSTEGVTQMLQKRSLGWFKGIKEIR